MNGIETLKEIKKFNSTTKVIMITSSGNTNSFENSLRRRGL